MTINIDVETRETIDFDYERIAEDVINATLDYENCPYECEVNMVLTDNEQIHEINQEFREIDRATDVLSFPMVDFDTPANYDCVEELGEVCFHPDTGELMLGDLMISVPKLIEQADAYGHSTIREFSFLITHSILHLLGYDHMTAEEASVMESKQTKILDSLGITR